MDTISAHPWATCIFDAKQHGGVYEQGESLNIPNILTLARIALIPVFWHLPIGRPPLALEHHGE